MNNEAAQPLPHTADKGHHWQYFDAPRTDANAASLTLGELGHMMDTLKDTILIMRQIGPQPKLTPDAATHVDRYFNQRGVRPYVNKVAGDVRMTHSFVRTDLGRSAEQKEHPDLAAFMNHLHVLLRGNSLRIGRSFVVPDALKADVERYDALVADYLTHVRNHSDPATGKPDYTLIPKDLMDAFAAEFTPLSHRICDALDALPEVEVELDGTRYKLPNQSGPLNPQLPASSPARFLFVSRFLGSGAADGNKRPATLEYHGRVGEVIGLQSMLTDTSGALIELMKHHGVPAEKLMPDSKKLEGLIGKYTHSFQLAFAFCHTADCGYPALYHDLEHFIHLAGADTTTPSLQTPQDVALLLYAVERGIMRHDDDAQHTDQLRKTLRNYADRMGACESIDEMQHSLQQDTRLGETLNRCLEVLSRNHMAYAAHTLTSIRTMFAPSPHQTHRQAR